MRHIFSHADHGDVGGKAAAEIRGKQDKGKKIREKSGLMKGKRNGT